MTNRDEIAIVGFAARLPGAANSDAFWSLLRSNRCSVSWITPDRFPTRSFYHPAPDQIGRSYTFAAGVIDNVWGFDAGAFGMSPREAEQVDPQHRHLLEVTHDALAHAGVRPSSLAGSDTGVFVGASSVDYAVRFFADPSVADVHMMTGNSLSIMANRISYALDLRGPSIAIDTACSSSLMALHLASEAIRSGTIDTAVVAGVNLLLSPFSYVGFSRASMLSPTGLCRPFDAAADGYVRSEGAITVVLRSMAAAHKARNRIHSVVVGSGTNQDGRTTGLAMPSPESQRRLLEQVYGDFAVDPADLSFVEAHGTGTRVGDPIEADALGKGLAQRRSQPLPIGSVKSNVGHLEPVSGLVGLLKSVLALNHRMVPATLHQKSPSPDIPFDELNLRVVDRNWHLPERRGPSLAGVNSFGFGGTNVHAILRSDEGIVPLVHVRSKVPPLVLTAHSAEALQPLAAAYEAHWPDEPRAAPDFVGASGHLRDLLPHRVLIRGGTADEVRQRVHRFAEGEKPPLMLSGQALGNNLPVAFLFSGNGSQWAGMGREAWRVNPCFRKALEEIDGPFDKAQKWSIVDALFSSDLEKNLRQASFSQPLLLALQVATVRALEEGGVTPAATLGHSIGEISSAWAAGALSLDQAIDVVVARSRHQECARGTGGMAALMLSENEARRFIKSANASDVDIAAVNSWRSVTVSGPSSEIDKVLAAAAALRISARRLDLDYPFHSNLVDPVRAPLLRELAGMKPLALRRKMISSVTGDIAVAESLSAEHWWRNVREPVQFEAAFGCLLKEGLRVFVEVGPKPILSSYARDSLREAGLRGVIIDTLSEADGQDTGDPIEQAISKVLLAGGNVDLQRFFGPPPATTIALPLYPWRHTQFMVRPTVEATTALIPCSHPLLGQRPRLDCMEWFATVDPVLFPWLEDHKVGDVCVFPAAAYVETMLGAAHEIHAEGALELRDLDIVRPLVFDGGTTFETQVRLAAETGVTEFLSRPRSGMPDWTLNARGIIGRSPIAGKVSAVPEMLPGTVVVAKPKVYESARVLGFTYGPTFQRARQVAFPHPKRAVATLDPPAAQLVGPYIIDLTALDTAFHALFASEEAGVADMPMKRMLPIRFGCVRSFKPGATATTAMARTLRQSPSSMVLDIELYDELGELIVSAENVRIIEAPREAAADPQSLGYHTATWLLDRAGDRSMLDSRLDVQPLWVEEDQAAPVTEALLLLEAGCLRASWQALGSIHGLPQAGRSSDGASDGSDWMPFLRSALLWHLEARDLTVDRDGERSVAPICELPDVRSIVNSLMVRHPKMAMEAASLARIGEILGRMVSGDAGVHAEFGSPHWRHLGVASNQARLLRQAVMSEVAASIGQCEGDRLLRLLMMGADHVAAVCDMVSRFPNLEVTFTDLDADRLEQARLLIGEDAPRIRCVPWTTLEEFPAGILDGAVAIDAMSEIAAAGGLPSITRLLRPGAAMLAGEMSPSLFWDIVRGMRPTWWARSASTDFPVGALLTSQEWVDELQTAGLADVTASQVGDIEVGFIIRGFAGRSAARVELPAVETQVFSWEGDETIGEALSAQLRRHIGEQHEAVAGGQSVDGIPADLGGVAGTGHSTGDPSAVTDVVWTINAIAGVADEAVLLGHHLTQLANRCRRLADAPARLWVVIDFGDIGADEGPLDQPMWCAIAAAMRVAQNEYAGLQVRCLGLAGSERPLAVEKVVQDMLAPEDERELFFVGDRRVAFRIQRGGIEPVTPPTRPDDMAVALTGRQESGRAEATWLEVPRTEPGVGEVEIEVAATGLNFRDVMWNLRLLPEEALEDGYAGAGFGMECAGTVVRVGPDAAGLQPGDPVVAFAPRAFASHVIAPEFAVSRLPPSMTFEAATTVPVAFLTAYYSLVHLGQLTAGQTVLVHGGAGAVGLAAIQIARLRGATIIATAGSEEKRALLRDYGVDFVCSSRSLSFADEVSTYTKGRGVDLVLNSLAGEAMVRSVDCLRPFGRFIELGKRDFYANTHLGLRPLRRNLSYFGVDVDQLIGEHEELTRRLFSELMRLFDSGQLVALPHRVFDGDHISDAFRLMQRSGHIGKIVVTPPARATNAGRGGGIFPVASKGTHVVIGGTGGFGLATAQWLVGRGATRLILASRSARLSDTDLAKVNSLRRRGIDVAVEKVDVCSFTALEQLLRQAGARHPIKGIVHAAMVLDDRLIEGMDREAIDTALAPKVTGALNLVKAARRLDLDYLLLYSSATTLFGNPGQFNYVAANGFMEAVARRMRAKGMPVLAVAWGGIEDAGYLSRNIGADANMKRRFASSLISAQAALDGLDWLYDRNGKQATACSAIARIDWAMAKRELAATRAPTFNAIGAVAGTRQSADAVALLERLRSLSVDDAAEALLEIVVEEIARVLRLPPKEVDRHRALAEIGMDSLMMLELRTVVESTLQVELPMMSLSSGITPADVARRIAPLVVGTGQKPSVPGTIVALSTSHFAAEAAATGVEEQHAAVSAVLERLRELEGPL